MYVSGILGQVLTGGIFVSLKVLGHHALRKQALSAVGGLHWRENTAVWDKCLFGDQGITENWNNILIVLVTVKSKLGSGLKTSMID